MSFRDMFANPSGFAGPSSRYRQLAEPQDAYLIDNGQLPWNHGFR